MKKDKSSNGQNELKGKQLIHQNEENLEISTTGYGFQSVPEKPGQIKRPRI